MSLEVDHVSRDLKSKGLSDFDKLISFPDDGLVLESRVLSFLEPDGYVIGKGRLVDDGWDLVDDLKLVGLVDAKHASSNKYRRPYYLNMM